MTEFVNLTRSELVDLFILELLDIRDGDGLKHLYNEDDTIDRYITLKQIYVDEEKENEV